MTKEFEEEGYMMMPGLRFKNYIKEFGYEKPSKLADDISCLVVSITEEDYLKQNLQKNLKNKSQASLSKIFNHNKTPGLKIIIHIINALGNAKPMISKRSIAKKIIEIYHNSYDYDDISTILLSFPEKDVSFHNSEKRSEINQEWFETNYNLLVKYGGLDWEDIETNYTELEKNVTNICKLINDCIVNKQYRYLKETYQYAENFLQICGHRSHRLDLSAELELAAIEKSDLETSIQAKASRAWSLVTDREILHATKILDGLIKDFDSLKIYSEKTNFSKIISYENLARIAIIQGKFNKAEHWFSKQDDEVEWGKQQFNLKPNIVTRYKLPIGYHQGRIFFYQGDFNSALSSFESTQESANKIGWTRMEICAQNWLGGIYTEIGDFKEAEELLLSGLDRAKIIKSKGRLGFYHRSLAILYVKSGRYFEANSQITKAYDVFEELGMKNAAIEVLRLIHTDIAS